jgi:hypothetical protein
MRGVRWREASTGPGSSGSGALERGTGPVIEGRPPGGIRGGSRVCEGGSRVIRDESRVPGGSVRVPGESVRVPGRSVRVIGEVSRVIGGASRVIEGVSRVVGRFRRGGRGGGEVEGRRPPGRNSRAGATPAVSSFADPAGPDRCEESRPGGHWGGEVEGRRPPGRGSGRGTGVPRFLRWSNRPGGLGGGEVEGSVRRAGVRGAGQYPPEEDAVIACRASGRRAGSTLQPLGSMAYQVFPTPWPVASPGAPSWL